MKHKRMRREFETASGWTRWIQPEMKKYYLGCCDCALYHEMQFRVCYTTKDGKLTPHVQFRARRAEGYTRRERKKAKK